MDVLFLTFFVTSFYVHKQTFFWVLQPNNSHRIHYRFVLFVVDVFYLFYLLCLVHTDIEFKNIKSCLIVECDQYLLRRLHKSENVIWISVDCELMSKSCNSLHCDRTFGHFLVFLIWISVDLNQ